MGNSGQNHPVLNLSLCDAALSAGSNGGSVLLTAQQASPAPDEANPGYAVTVEGHEVFRVNEGLGPFSAQERAQRISERLTKLVYTPSADLTAITTSESDYGTEIKLSDDVLTIVTDDDAKQVHLVRSLLAKYYITQIRDAVAQARRERSARFLIKAAIYALVTLLLYLSLVWLVVIGTRRLLMRLKRLEAPLVKGIKIQQSEILAGERIAKILAGFVRLLRIAVLFVLTWVFLGAEFNYFPWTRVHGRQLLDYVLTPVRFVASAFLNYLPNLFYILVILAVMYYVLKFVALLAREFERGKISLPGFYPEWIQPTYKIVRFLIFAFTAVLVYPYLPGNNSPAFKGVGLFLGVLFSLGSTSAVANIVAGIILTYTRGFRVGDWVKIADNLGEVLSQNMLATHLRTVKNEEIVIPNSVVLNSHVTNYSLLAHSKGLILHTSVTIGYDAPWRTVHELLIEAALKTDNILASPAPFVLQSALQDSYVQYEINAYTNQPAEMISTYSKLHANIQDCFYAGGVEIMSPIYSAIRDGNKTAIPAEFLPPDYRPQGFRIAKPDDADAAAAGVDR